MKFLYQLEIRPERQEEQKLGFLAAEPVRDPADRAYFEHLINGVATHRSSIDAIIQKYLRGWTMERQLLIDLTILRIAIFELLFDTEVPTEIAISEAVIFANDYGADESRAFINAVLGSVDKNESRKAVGRGEAGDA